MVQKLSSIVGFLLFLPLSASAQIIITEVMYDVEGTDSDREWVEVQNTGSEPVNLTDWKFYESNSNHGLTAYQGSETLASGAYAIIVDSPTKFMADWPSFSGQVFDSSFALNNTGETLVLRCCGKELSDRDSVTYNATGGGTGDGLSLHRNGSSITAAEPSPGSGVFSVPPPPQKEEIKSEPVAAPKSEPKVEPPHESVTQKAVQPKVEESAGTSDDGQAIPTATPTLVVQEENPTPVPQKKSKIAKKEVNEEAEDVINGGERADESEEQQPPVTQLAAASSPRTSNDVLWWLGAAAISVFGAGGAYVAGRSQRKRDWKIEEIE